MAFEVSLEALAAALTADLPAEVSLTLIHLADGAIEGGVTVPFLPLLASKVGVNQEQLRLILDELVADGLISPCNRHPFDFFANTEGFRLHLDRVPTVEHVESPWSKDLRSGG